MPPLASYSSQLDGSLRIVTSNNTSKHGNGSLLVQNGAEFFGSDDQYLRTSSASADLYLGSKKNINIGSTDALQINVGRLGQNTNIKGAVVVDQASTLNGAVTANNNLSVSGTSNLQSAVSCGSTLSVAQNSTLSGAVQCDSTLNVTGSSEFTGAVDCKSSLIVDTTTLLKGAVQMDNNCVIAGNLTVQGSTTTVDTQNVLVKDNIMVLNSAAEIGKDAGLLFHRNNADSTSFYWDESAGEFVFGSTESLHTDSVVVNKAFSDIRCKNINVTQSIAMPGFAKADIVLKDNDTNFYAFIPNLTKTFGSVDIQIEGASGGSMLNYKLVKSKATGAPVKFGIHTASDTDEELELVWADNEAPKVHHKVVKTAGSGADVPYVVRFLSTSS